jgi:hypothetical protein
MIFLMHYDPARGRIVDLRQFNDDERGRAEETRLQLEISLRDQNIEREVVLLEANNEIALRRTHRRYFESLQRLST